MNTLKNYKGIIIAVVLFGIFILGYNMFFKASDLLLTSEAASTPVGDDVLEMFNALERVNLDPSIFSSLGYRLLTDFSTPIPVQSIGRKNPFDIIGRN